MIVRQATINHDACAEYLWNSVNVGDIPDEVGVCVRQMLTTDFSARAIAFISESRRAVTTEHSVTEGWPHDRVVAPRVPTTYAQL